MEAKHFTADPEAHRNYIIDEYIRYLNFAQSTRYPSFDERRKSLVREPGTFAQQPYIELLPTYELTDYESHPPRLPDQYLPDCCPKTRAAIRKLLPIIGGFETPVFQHQAESLQECMRRGGNDVVICSGTGSGKTEAFLFGVLGRIVREALESPQTWKLGDRRRHALRAIILYPMNALVEDQMRRLRRALDSDDARNWRAEHLQGLPITFGRYTSATPSAGHPFELKNGAARKNRGRSDRVSEAMQAAQAQADALREAGFVEYGPRDPGDQGAPERITRDQMQANPPDLLVTNSSMLQVMLQRGRSQHPAFSSDKPDSSDGDIFESTARWLQEDGAQLSLVVDELHLYRGTAGAEVAGLVRLLIDRLGLSLDSRKLRIVASSASLGNDAETEEFFSAFFGRKPVRVLRGLQRGEQLPEPTTASIPLLPRQQIDRITDQQLTNLDLSPYSDALRQACRRTRPKADCVSLQEASRRLTGVGTVEMQAKVAAALASRPTGDGARPRFRLHWLFAPIEGIWGSPAPSSDECPVLLDSVTLRRPCAAETSPDNLPKLQCLYCDECGELFFGGYNCTTSRPREFGLRLEMPDLERAPLEFEPRTSSETLDRFRVIWIPRASRAKDLIDTQIALNTDRHILTDSKYWARRPGELKEIGRRQAVNAHWAMCRFDRIRALLTPLSHRDGGEMRALRDIGDHACLAFWTEFPRVPNESDETFSERRRMAGSAPMNCPACGADRDQWVPWFPAIRPFQAGADKLTEHLATKLTEPAVISDPSAGGAWKGRRLVAFSDSRNRAAEVAVDVEYTHWREQFRSAVIGCLRDARSPIRLSELEVADLARAAMTEPGPMIKERIRSFATRPIRDADLAQIREYLEVLADDPGAADRPHPAHRLLRPRTAETSGLEVIRLDEALLGHSAQGELWPLARRLLESGVPLFPNGNCKLSEGFEISGDNSWLSRFDWSEGSGWRLRAGADDALLKTRLLEVVVQEFSRSGGYSLESMALGHWCAGPSSPNATSQASLVPLDRLLRFLTRRRKVRLSTGNWQPDFRRPTKLDLHRMCHRLSLSDWTRACLPALQHLGHLDGLVNPAAIEVAIADAKSPTWTCQKCGENHLYFSDCGCIRCSEPLPLEPSANADEIWRDLPSSRQLESGCRTWRMHCEELTGQTDDPSQRQRHFDGVFVPNDRIAGSDDQGRAAIRSLDEIDLLSVTTTMEAGVDIGALSSILLANMPPQRFNYQQRAGRAGRRDQPVSVTVSVCRGSSHDRFHFAFPDPLIADAPPPPNLSQHTEILQRVMRREALRYAFHKAGIDWLDSHGLNDNHGEFGSAQDWLADTPGITASASGGPNTPGRQRSVRGALEEFAATQALRLADVLTVGTCVPAESIKIDVDALITEITKAAGDPVIRGDGLAERLARKGLLPLFGMPSDTVSIYHGMRGRSTVMSIERSARIAVSEFAPGSLLLKDKFRYRTDGFTPAIDVALRRSPSNVISAPADTPTGQPWVAGSSARLIECRLCNVATRSWASVPACSRCGRPVDSQSILEAEYREPTAYRAHREAETPWVPAPRPSIMYDEVFEDAVPVRAGEATRVRLLWLNSRGGAQFECEDAPRLPFPPGSSKSGDVVERQVLSPPRSRFPNGPASYRIGIMASHVTDAVELWTDGRTRNLVRSLRECRTPGHRASFRAALYSATELLRRNFLLHLDLSDDDFESGPISTRLDDPDQTTDASAIMLFDGLANGSGFSRLFAAGHESMIRAFRTDGSGYIFAESILGIEHRRTCAKGCYSCLRSYRNRFIDPLLDWRLGAAFIRMLERGGSHHDTPSRVPMGLDGNWKAAVDLEDIPDMTRSGIRRLERSLLPEDELLTSEFEDLKADLEAHWLGGTSIRTDQRTIVAIGVHPLWNISDLREPVSFADVLAKAKMLRDREGREVEVRFVDWFNLATRPDWVEQDLRKAVP